MSVGDAVCLQGEKTREEKFLCRDKPQNCIEFLRKIKRVKTRWLLCENRHFILMARR